MTTSIPVNHNGRRWALAAKLAFWPLVLLSVVLLAFQFGAGSNEIRIAGPFYAETNSRALLLAVPREGPLPFWRQPLFGDDSRSGAISRLKLQINGEEIGPAHAIHTDIRNGSSRGFSHWEEQLIFALPLGVPNGASTKATLRYSSAPRTWVMAVALVPTILLAFILYRVPLGHLLILLARAPYLAFAGILALGLAAVIVLIGSSIYASAAGWALPTTALIREWSVAEWAARNEPYLPYAMLMLAGIGALMTWLVELLVSNHFLKADEHRVRNYVYWSGLPIAASAFTLSTSAMWSGLVRVGDPHLFNIGGLIPFSDAASYVGAAYDQVRDGPWDELALRRPLAAAFRSSLLFIAQYSLPLMLLAQALLLGAASWLASCAVMAWRGVWAGVAFFSLSYIYARGLAPTPMTEPLGLFFALLSVPFFINSFRSRSVASALVAIAMTTLALMTRMGSMFAIPALLVWVVWQFGTGIAAKARIGLVAIGIIMAVVGLSSALERTYGSGGRTAAANSFAWVICGITMGTKWDGCPKTLAAQGMSSLPEHELVAKMYSMAWDNFRANPTVSFKRLQSARKEFTTYFPETVWKGYRLKIDEPAWFFREGLIVLMIAGLLFVLARRTNSIELSFWAFFWVSLVASGAIVYFDDGMRALATSFPLAALFLAIGLVNPALREENLRPSRTLPLYGSIGLLLTALCFGVLPWLGHRTYPAFAEAARAMPMKPSEFVVFGGKRMSGFLVVADGQPLRTDIPTMHYSKFEDIVAQSGVEGYQGLLHPIAPPVPFGFVFTPRMERGAGSPLSYIVPPKVLEQRDVPVWRFKVASWRHKQDIDGNGQYWFYVTDAIPWSTDAQ